MTIIPICNSQHFAVFFLIPSRGFWQVSIIFMRIHEAAGWFNLGRSFDYDMAGIGGSFHLFGLPAVVFGNFDHYSVDLR